MTCPACDASKADPTNGEHWRSGCRGCEARALAVTRADLGPVYQFALKQLFGKDAEAGDARVQQWLGLIRRAKAAA